MVALRGLTIEWVKVKAVSEDFFTEDGKVCDSYVNLSSYVTGLKSIHLGVRASSLGALDPG